MKIYFSPCKSDKETNIQVIDENNLEIDGELFSFDSNDVQWENLYEATNGKILDAYRNDGEMYIKIVRFYKESCPWDTGTYRRV